MASIAFDGVWKVFQDGTRAVDGLDLEFADGEFTILVGPSGAGESTALRMVAGLEDATDGEITIGARVVNDVAPKDRDIAMVFQSYALYAHMSVSDNIGFALRMRRQEKGRDARLHRAAASGAGGTTTLYVTHDQTEAMTMRDQVAVMRDGRLEQVDSPQRLYEQPSNLLRAVVDDDGLLVGDQRLRFPPSGRRRCRRLPSSGMTCSRCRWS